MVPTLQSLTADVARYAQAPADDLYPAIGQRIAQVSGQCRAWSEEEQAELEKLMVRSAKVEPIWGLLAGTCLWASGRHREQDFHNVWNCSRYAGIQSRFSRLSPQDHLRNLATVYEQANATAAHIISGNALRQLHTYAEAESAYLQGLERVPDSPFLKLRLVDQWLMTYQHARAAQLLASLRARFPFALEMMFTLPIPEDAAVPDNLFPHLDPGDAEHIWFVAADPVYIQRYGPRLAKSVAAVASRAGNSGLRLHVHVPREADCPVPLPTLQAMAALVPVNITQRTLDLSRVTPNQRATIFACERFLFLAEMLAKYDRPMLLTDIDVECLQDPSALFAQMGDADIVHTRFATVRDAWDRYPATVLLARPTPAAIAFFKKLSGMLLTLLRNHPQPWFADQIALFRLIEEGLTSAKLTCREHLMTDTDSPKAYFRILHGSWASD